MKLFFPITAAAGLVIFTATLEAQLPRITTVEPDTAKVGDLVSAKGQEMDNANVDMLYLTDGVNDFKCEMVEQTATAIKFKVPGTIKPGRWALMVRTKKGQLVEEPVKLTVK
jgi:hypothetical protein